jgi:hypothetical protein
MKEFFELKMGSITMDEYDKRFFKLSKYVDFIKDDKFKIQKFLKVGYLSSTVTRYNMITPRIWRIL